MLLTQLSPGFQTLLLPTRKLGPSGADSLVGQFVYTLEPCGSLQWTLLWGWEFLLLPQPPQVFTIRGLEDLSPCAGTLCCTVCLTPQLFSPGTRMQIWDHPVHQQPLPWCVSSPPLLPVPAPPTSLNECFFFNSLVVGLPYSSIFWQLRLFFAYKFVVVFLSVVHAGKVYLPMPPS